MVAQSIAARAGCPISGVEIAEWNLDLPALRPGGDRTVQLEGQHVPVELLARLLATAQADVVIFAGYGQRLENFPPIETCRRLFDARHIEVDGYGPDDLVINVRGAEILSGTWKQYTLVPVNFYAELIAQTGLRPVFMGQIGDDSYSNELRSRFPVARFERSRGAIEDFEIIRRSSNIVISVSTFSWLAAWLSHATTIFCPLTGFLSPFHDLDVDLVPTNDPRYKFYLFPLNFAEPVETLDKAHDPMNGSWRAMPNDIVARLKRDAPRFGRVSEDVAVSFFDRTFYERHNPDIKRSVEDGSLDSALFHYIHHGRAEGRMPFDFDDVWYSRRYILAAIEVGQGDFASLRDHYMAVGRRRGYLPMPPSEPVG